MGNNNDQLHDLDSYRIALYYCYVDIDNVPHHMAFQKEICDTHQLQGRIRVSSEGLNGVLSGQHSLLLDYQTQIEEQIGKELHIKYCLLRKDISIASQLFSSVSIKATREVVSLYEQMEQGTINDAAHQHLHHSIAATETSSSFRIRRRNRNRKKPKTLVTNEQVVQQESGFDSSQVSVSCHQQCSNSTKCSIPKSPRDSRLAMLEPCTHLSPMEWNQHLMNFSKNTICEGHSNDAILVDARNGYESRVGYFQVEGVPTLLTNTRKYSSLPQVFVDCQQYLAGKTIYMYCTGGVRCERASVFLQALDWGKDCPKAVYQLDGGIQRYLEHYGSESSRAPSPDCLYHGKNFVFDPRRTDPVWGKGVVGQCLLCAVAHDDYDNGKAPCQENEARCCKCRVLVLVCEQCRETVISWGEDDNDSAKPKLLCGTDVCTNEGSLAQASRFI